MTALNFSSYIFDMDGVIVNSEECWEDIEQQYLASVSPNWDPACFENLFGLSNVDVYKFVGENFNVTVSYKEFKRAYDTMAEDVYGVRTKLIEGVANAIERVHQRQARLAIASSSPPEWINTVMTRWNLGSYFPIITSGSELPPGEGKPKPLIYEMTAERLGVQPKDCAVIEDSRNGVLAAKGADMFCFGLRNGTNDEQDLSLADFELRNGFQDFLSAIETSPDKGSPDVAFLS